MTNEAIPAPASLTPAPIQQSLQDAATEASIEAVVTNAPPQKTEAAFNRATVEHRRSAQNAERPDPDSWRDGNDVAPLEPMPAMGPMPTVEVQEIEAAREKLWQRGYQHADLVTKWGSDFGNNLAFAKAAFKEIAASDPDLIAKVEASGLGDHPAVLTFLAKQGRLAAGLMNDNTISQRNYAMPINRTTAPGPSGNQRGSEETRNELNELMRANPPGSANYKQPHVQNRIQHLNQILAGSGAIIGQGGRTS